VARVYYSSGTSYWAYAGDPGSTDTTLLVGRLSKGNSASYPDDCDRWDLWTFDATTGASVLDFRTSQDSMTMGNGKTSFDSIGIRTAAMESDDRILYDEVLLGTRLTDVVPTIVGIPAKDLICPKTLDFEAAPNGPISPSDPLFTEFGISGLAATGGSQSGDVQNQNNQSGKGLFYDGSQFLILPQDNDPFNNNAYPFGVNQTFKLQFDTPHRQFGCSFQDQTNQDFTFSFYNSGVLQGSITQYSPTVVNTQFIFETPFWFDEVWIDGATASDGFGIDNLVVDTPEPATLSLLALGALGLLTRRRRC